MKTCVLLDYNNLMHRAIHQSYSEQRSIMERSYGESMRIPDIFTIWKNNVMEAILSYITTFNCSKMIITVDSKNSWRKKIYHKYKGSRQKRRDDSPIDYEELFKISNKFLEDLRTIFPNFYFLKLSECEVDDIIAVLCREVLTDYQNVVVSTDSDFNQLLQQDNVRRYNPLYKVQSFVEVTNPKHELAVKVMCGDSSDEIPSVLVMEGVEFEGKTIGCGEKTAEDILHHGVDSAYVLKKVSNKYKTLKTEDILKNVKENWERNNMLINFDFIPVDLRQRIRTAYDNYQLKRMDNRAVLNFFRSNNMRKVYDNFGAYSAALAKIDVWSDFA